MLTPLNNNESERSKAFLNLRLAIRACNKCPLHLERKQPVPGEGSINSKIVLIGEAPGFAEDRTGVPFSGKEGKKLDEWLTSVNISRADIFTTNTLKCRPEKGRYPEDDSSSGPPQRCAPWILKQLAMIEPLVVVLSGQKAVEWVLTNGTARMPYPMQSWVGNLYRRRDPFGEIRFAVIYSPREIIRSRNYQDERACLDMLRTVQDFVAARTRNAPAPLVDLVDIRPALPPEHQQRLRLF